MPSLTVLNPVFLSWLPVAALPVVFHLFFRLKKHSRAFPTLMFFQRLDPKLDARRRLRQWLILLLRTLLILCLLLALARPVWLGIGKEGTVAVALVIDNSGSMSGSGEEDRAKLKQAVDAARSVVLQLGPKDSAGIVLLVDDPAFPLPAGLTSDKVVLRNALDRIAETEASGSVAGAIERAASLFEGSSATHFEIHVLSDLQEEKWVQRPVSLRAPRRGTSLVVHRLASAPATQANVSLAGASIPTRSILAGRRLRLEAYLVNSSAKDGQVRLNWRDDAGNHGSDELTVPAQADKTATITLEPQNPGFRWVSVWVEGDDFAADNRGSVGFFCAEKRSVLFGGPSAEFGQLPLAISPTGSESRSGLVPSFIAPAALADLLRSQPASFVVITWQSLARAPDFLWVGLEQFLTAGGTALILPAAGSTGSEELGWGGQRPGAGRSSWLTISPEALQSAPDGLAVTILDPTQVMFNDLRDAKGQVALHNLRALRFRPLKLAGGDTPVFGLEDGRVLLAEQKVGRGRLLASGLAFDSAWSTLPLKPGFVALAQNLALSGTVAATNVISIIAGEPLHLTARANASLQVQSLAGSPLDWKGTAAQLATLPRSGVYHVRTAGDTTYVAVRSSDKEGRQKFIASDNLPALGSLAYMVKDYTGTESLLTEFRRLEKSLDLSLVLLLLALACLAAEGWLANPLPMKTTRPGGTSHTAGQRSPAVRA